jgi:superfamily II DNA or RNA helicase
MNNNEPSLLRSVQFQADYASVRDDLVADFFIPSLSQSSHYDRAVGYFRASVLTLVLREIMSFVEKGGKIRIVCSSDLPKDHVDAALEAYANHSEIFPMSAWLDNLKQSESGSAALSFFATLIAQGHLDLKIAVPKDGSGVFHDKIGVFTDDSGNQVSFRGSSNESFSGWDPSGNHESFDAFTSWSQDKHRVDNHAASFERLWTDDEVGLEVVPLPEAAHRQLIREVDSEGLEHAFRKFERLQGEQAKVKKRKTPQPHQLEAIRAWEAAGCSGILAHATGSGKTFTALTAMRDWTEGKNPILVLVPSERLLSQWEIEISDELEDVKPTILLAGGGNTNWRRPGVLESFLGESDRRRIVLSTVHTASSTEFIKRTRASHSDQLLLVSDEVHWLGAPEFSRILSIEAKAKLGLSATPTRYGDPDGTAAIMAYFKGVVHEFTLRDAVQAGRLCKYNYAVHFANMSEDELEEWDRLTETIQREFAIAKSGKNSDLNVTEKLKFLLIRRSRIVKNAEVKPLLAAQVLNEQYTENDRWLVYCDNRLQMEQVQVELERMGISSDNYHSEMTSDKEATLDRFNVKGGVLVSIKCLDEGVDIPNADHALILASSTNPREFIQRRGRVLRTAENKYIADIHDVMVMPPNDKSTDDNKRESIVRSELARAIEFAGSALNLAVRHDLLEVAASFSIDDMESTLGFDYEDDGDELDE